MEEFFIDCCEHNNFEAIKRIVNDGFNIIHYNEWGFRLACQYGHLDIIKFLINSRNVLDIYAYDENGFRWACLNEHLEVIKYLMSLTNPPDIHIVNDLGLQNACLKGHLEIVKYLINLDKPNIHNLNSSTFQLACVNGGL